MSNKWGKFNKHHESFKRDEKHRDKDDRREGRKDRDRK
jgi:hypothetical protein